MQVPLAAEGLDAPQGGAIAYGETRREPAVKVGGAAEDGPGKQLRASRQYDVALVIEERRRTETLAGSQRGSPSWMPLPMSSVVSFRRRESWEEIG